MNHRIRFLSIEPGRPWTRYVMAAMAVVAAAILQWMLRRVSGDIPPFLVFFMMVTLVTRALGGRAGVLATVLSIPPVAFLFIGPLPASGPPALGEALTLGLFCASCLLVILMAEPRHRIRQVAAKTTESKYGEDALRRSEERFRIAQELSLDAFVILSAVRDDEGIVRDFRCEFANPTAGRLLGHIPEELIGKRLLQVLPSLRMHSDLLDRFVHVLQTGEPHDYELYYEGDGLQGWFRNMAVRLGDGVAVCFADITARKQAEDELRASKERFELAVRGAGVGIWDWDIRTGKVYYSPRWKTIFGYAENEIGEGFDDWARLLHPDEAAYVCQYQADFLAGTGSSVTLEYRLRHKDGLYRWIEAHAVVVRDEHGKACRLVGSHGDITARKQAEQRLHADLDALTRLHEISGRQLREDNVDAVLSEIMAAAVAIAAADRGILRLIDPVTGSLRLAAQHGHQPRFLEFLASPGNSITEGGEAIGSGQRIVVPDVEDSPLFHGTRMLLELRTAGVRSIASTPITSRNGRLLGVLTTQWAAPHAPDDHDLWRIDLLARQTADLIEQKQSQEERAKWAAQLQRSQQLEALGVLAGGIAHDFNNLLAGILGHVEMARTDAEAGEVAKAVDTLREAVGTMDRARALTDQLITFAKGGAPHRKPTKMAPLLRDTASLVLSGSNVSIDWNIEENLWPCNVDRNQLSQALGNILLNARESMPGGGEVHIGARNLPQGANLPQGLSPGGYVLISIRDEGPGIAQDLLERVFDPFFTTKSTGHGLGLTVAHSVIKRHDGRIEVQSDGRKGATFNIYLPGAPDTAVADDVTKPELSYTGKGSILLMEDDAAVRKVVSRMLQTTGYTVACASRGEEAIELYRKGMAACQPFDLVILDLTVRDGLGGKATLVELRGLDPSVRAIVSSGYHDDPVMQNPTAHGFLTGLAKPYSLSEMKATLQRVQEAGGSPRRRDGII